MTNRLFDKTADGLLFEVHPDERENRRVSHVNMSVDILWTDEDETARDAEEIAVNAENEERSKAQKQTDEVRASALEKLSALGLSPDEIAALTKR